MGFGKYTAVLGGSCSMRWSVVPGQIERASVCPCSVSDVVVLPKYEMGGRKTRFLCNSGDVLQPIFTFTWVFLY